MLFSARLVAQIAHVQRAVSTPPVCRLFSARVYGSRSLSSSASSPTLTSFCAARHAPSPRFSAPSQLTLSPPLTQRRFFGGKEPGSALRAAQQRQAAATQQRAQQQQQTPQQTQAPPPPPPPPQQQQQQQQQEQQAPPPSTGPSYSHPDQAERNRHFSVVNWTIFSLAVAAGIFAYQYGENQRNTFQEKLDTYVAGLPPALPTVEIALKSTGNVSAAPDEALVILDMLALLAVPVRVVSPASSSALAPSGSSLPPPPQQQQQQQLPPQQMNAEASLPPPGLNAVMVPLRTATSPAPRVFRFTDASGALVLTEPAAVGRYLSRLYGLYGQSAAQAAQIDEYVDQLLRVLNTNLTRPQAVEMMRLLDHALRKQSPEAPAPRTSGATPVQYDTPYLCGAIPSYADLLAYRLVGRAVAQYGPALIDDLRAVRAHYQSLQSRIDVPTYVANMQRVAADFDAAMESAQNVRRRPPQPRGQRI